MSGSTLSRNTAGGVGAGIILWILIVAMLIFTSIRTVHLLQLTFPPDQQYVAYLGLTAFDIGVLIWFFYASQKARGAAQRAVAYGMIFVCALGVILATIADFFYQADHNGVVKLPPQLVTLAIWGVIIVICLNFLAGIIAHLVDPHHIQRMKEEQLHDKIITAAHNHMDTMTDQIAPQIAAVLADEWRDRVTAELIGKLPQGRATSIVSGPVVQGSIAAPQEEKEVSLAHTVDEPGLVAGVVAGVKGLIADLRKPEPAPEPAPAPVTPPKRGFMAAPKRTPRLAANGRPKKELPKRTMRHHRTRVASPSKN